MLIKFAAATLELVEDARRRRHPMVHRRRTAARHNFRYTARPGYIYVRCRAISSRINENYDGFSAEEIAKAYRTFIGKPVFVNHHNEDINRKRGVIIDAALHRDANCDGSPDTWTELLMEIDAVRFPRLAEAIVKGHMDRTSMGTAVGFTICSYCGNRAEVPEQYCKHVRSLKGQRIIRNQNGRKEAVLVYEECHNLAFFENSILVEDPADPTAAVLGVESGPATVTASRKQKVGSMPEKFIRTAFAFRPMDTFDEPATEQQMRTALKLIEAKPRWAPHEHPWFVQHPISSQNIIDHYDRATPEDIGQGASWYSDANLVAKALGKGNTAMGAGVLAAYSPQTLWPVNMHNAARAIEAGKGLGGPGSGMMATGAMARSADRMIKGEHHSQVLKGPKIQDFAHLIEHGGDEDPTQPHAVIDRHALSVAAGRRLTDEENEHAPIATRHYYGHVVQAYKDAADQLSQREGHPIYPHQVQATTWLVRQRENALADQAAGGGMNKGRGVARERAADTWNQYAKEHYPSLIGPGYHGASKVARRAVRADEQTAPPKVDTLQPEACPVCQNTDSWSNNQCSACGYEAPPHPFDAPDVEQAQDADIHNGQPLDEEAPEPPLYMGQRSIPRKTVERTTGMTSNTAARSNIHKRLDDQQKQINGMGGLLQAIAGSLGVTAADVPPQFLDQQKGSGDSDSSSSDSGGSDSVDKDSQDYKDGYSDGKAGKDKSGSGKNYDAGYDAGKSASSDSDSDSDSSSSSSSDDTSKESVRERRRRAYLALKTTAESNEQAVAPDAKDDPQNIGASPAAANTEVTPDATTSVDSSPDSTVLTTDDAHKEDVEAPEPGVDTPPSPDAAKDPVDIVAPPPVDNSTSFNTGNGVAWSAKGDPQTRLFAAMRLAKLQRVAGIETDDELVLAQKIVDSEHPLPMIQSLSGQLDQIITAAKARQSQKTATNNLVPQTRTAERTRPSLSSAAPSIAPAPSTGVVSPDEFGDLP